MKKMLSLFPLIFLAYLLITYTGCKKDQAGSPDQMITYRVECKQCDITYADATGTHNVTIVGTWEYTFPAYSLDAASLSFFVPIPVAPGPVYASIKIDGKIVGQVHTSEVNEKVTLTYKIK
jgi:hypothetical protein